MHLQEDAFWMHEDYQGIRRNGVKEQKKRKDIMKIKQAIK
jgi:hypothetical protein